MHKIGKVLLLTSTLATAPACRDLVINAKGPDAPAAAPAKPKKAAFVFTDSGVTGAQTGMLTEMIQDFNKGAGYDALIVPLPSTTPTSEVDWISDASGLESGICKGVQRAGKPPTMLLQLSSAYAVAHVRELGKLSDAEFYRAFAHCVGHALGFAHATTATDVMQPDFTQPKDYAAFFSAVNAVTF
jgi:hypothetical protein